MNALLRMPLPAGIKKEEPVKREVFTATVTRFETVEEVMPVEFDDVLNRLIKLALDRGVSYDELRSLVGSKLCDASLVKNFGNQSQVSRDLKVNRGTLRKVISK